MARKGEPLPAELGRRPDALRPKRRFPDRRPLDGVTLALKARVVMGAFCLTIPPSILLRTTEVIE